VGKIEGDEITSQCGVGFGVSIPGKVYLIGAGPGDPELITCKGRRILERADSVLFDHLAPAALLDLAPAHAERLYVGKKKSVRAFSQEEICAMLIDRAQRGLTVVRLKGGDPLIFGRGGEEAEALSDAGIPFEMVPGVTVPLGIAAYTGIPLTHRGRSSAVSFVTGHSVDAIDWASVGQSETLVIFMGIFAFTDIARELIARGRSPETPAIAVRWATRPDQETLEGTLASLPQLIADHGMKPPATIVVGEVVRLRGKLNWYERLPLFGRRIVTTRAKGQAGALTSRLKDLGADVLELPTIEIQPAADYGPLDRALANLSSYDWLIFTSANGVSFFLDRLDRSVTDLRALRAKICAIGPATRAAVEARVCCGRTVGGVRRLRSGGQPRPLAKSSGGSRSGASGARAPWSTCRRGGSLSDGDASERRRRGRAHLRRHAQTGLHHFHQFFHRAEFRRSGWRRGLGRSQGRVDRARDFSDSPQSRHRGRHRSARVYRRWSC
jgi:uroporphyrin-III C-methyltransferase